MESERGQILIEIVVTVGLLTILFHAVFTLINAAFQSLGDSQARQTARHIAQSKIEEIKNLPYDEIGTQGGIPAGNLVQTETVNQNGLDYLIRTSIVFVDDPFDDFSPADLLPTDYKRVRVEVSWSGLFSSNRPAVLVTDIAPPGMEEPVAGGTIEIAVFDAQVEPVAEAEVKITNDAVSPAIDLDLRTNQEGKILLPGAPACSSCYFIEATKDGYTTDRTYSTDEVVNPAKGYLTVEVGKVAETSLKIDKVSTLNFYSSEPGVAFHLTSSKVIGTDAEENKIYKLDEGFTVDENGELVLEDFEWATYEFDIVGQEYDIAGTNPFTPINLEPDSEMDFQFLLAGHEENRLLVRITDIDDQPIASASARLFDGGDYDEATASGQLDEPDYGQVFFSPLEAKDYQLEVEAEDYQPETRTAPVDGWTIEEVILEQ